MRGGESKRMGGQERRGYWRGGEGNGRKGEGSVGDDVGEGSG